MFDWMSQKGKKAWQFLIWFLIFSYIPILPAYFIMSLEGLLGLTALIYVAISMLIIFKLYIRYENQVNIKKSIKSV
ncbi:MAG: hypothetical protein AYK22_00485 [Thermoplasmatales archaeon SG8-52-3]|nr:MAG: hypothetical protein AYK22_00485 [Thermoplasmatales archaeon SG8-52-3]